ncbi:suppressor of cytokine signaling 7 [Trichomycterus rosablanca]|uniref:suppressor of cytokine signaling 7 n=1 Tax=Trichomycterus rosablanca TaxID=2290929 RepID=UPI002F35C77A
MNNGQDMSPDFVLMRLVSAAEDDRLDEENGNLSSGTEVVTGNVKGKHECAQNPVALGHLSAGNKAAQPCGSNAPDTGDVAGRSALSVPPAQLHSAEARIYDLSNRTGMGPQLLVFRNVSRDSEGLSENNADNRHAFDEQATHSSESSASINNNSLSAVDAQHHHHPPWSLHSHPHTANAELCPRHRIIGNTLEWSDKSNLDTRWTSTTVQGDLHFSERPVLELARKFGELGVTAVPDFLLKDGDVQHCSCSATTRQGEDPTETSDALLVLEGLGSDEVNGLGMKNNPDSQKVKPELMDKMPGALALECFPSVLSGQSVGGLCSPSFQDSQLCCLLRGSLTQKAQLNPSETVIPQVPTPSVESTVNGLLHDTLCSSLSSSPNMQQKSAAASGEKALKVSGKSRKGSLKIRLSKLFRTKSCSGSNNFLEKRPSINFSISSASSLVDMSGTSSAEQDTTSQSGLTRAQNGFSGAPVFTGETVSLVDVDISQRGRNSPHPPTPPPPPRRSLSLLDDIGGPHPGPFLVNVMGASLQSLPLPLPPPPSLHATIQHSLSLNDAFLRALPHSAPSPIETPPPVRVAPAPNVCPLKGVDSSSFTASLRELERCGWYWGPMNWEDAELKLKGKPDGSFLVRDSSDPRYILSLSFRSQGVTHHTRMEHYRGTFSLWCHPKFEDRCHSVVEFIERAIMHSKNGKFLYFLRSRVPGLPPTPVQLLYPVSRFCNVKSLQHLCRFCIRQLVRIDHIQELPLPKPLIAYLKKFYYYDPEEEMYLSVKGMRQMAGVEQESESET